MKLSVITPVFNGEKFLEHTLTSVLSALPAGAEYLVVDDGSTDATPNILARFSERVRILRQQNLGEATAVNTGLRSASGEAISVVNSDDLVSSDWLQRAVNVLELEPDIVVAYPDWQVIDASGDTLRTIIVPDYSQRELVARFNCLPGPGAVFRRSAAVAAGLRNPAFRYVSDYDFWLRLSLQGEFRHVPTLGAWWREHESGTTAQANVALMQRERIDVIEAFYSSPNLSNTVQAWEREARANAYFAAARLSLRFRGVPARRLTIRALWHAGGLPSTAHPLHVLAVFLNPLSRAALGILRKRGLAIAVTRRGLGIALSRF